MNFSIINVTFRQLLGNGLSYHVPPFQRDYSWTEDEWDDLWQDITGLFEPDGEPAHYMGYLVLQSPDSRRFDVIDGQQRITTISLLVLAALSHLQDLIDKQLDAEPNAQRIKQLRSSYIGYLDPVSLVPQPKLELNRNNNTFYQNYLVPLQAVPIRGLKASEHLLRKAFDWLKGQLKVRCGMEETSGKNVAAFVDALVDRIFFTQIIVTDELNAFKVFETLNARGVRLSATDLLKNYLFSMVARQELHSTELKAVEDRWARIVGLLGSESFPDFLRVFWNSRNRLARKLELFKAVSRSIATKEAAFQLLRDLDQSAAVYAALRDPQDPIWNKEERQALDELQLFGVQQPLAMLLACHARFFESDRLAFTRVLQAVATLCFRYNVICNLPPNEQERSCNAIATEVAGGALATAAKVIAALEPMYPKDDQFKAAFASKELRTANSRSKNIARYILFAIEGQESGQRLDAESATYTLEHILPENPGEGWNHIEEAKQEALVHRLGNLALLEAAANRKAGNAGYPQKREAYAQSAVRTTQAIAERHEDWTARAVEARQQRQAATATAIWRLNFV